MIGEASLIFSPKLSLCLMYWSNTFFASGVMKVAKPFILLLIFRPGFRFTMTRGTSSSNSMSPSLRVANAPTRKPLLDRMRIMARSRRDPMLRICLSSSFVGIRSATTTSSPGIISSWILRHSISTSLSWSHFLTPLTICAHAPVVTFLPRSSPTYPSTKLVRS